MSAVATIIVARPETGSTQRTQKAQIRIHLDAKIMVKTGRKTAQF
jgi:hypothetical protein